jgi:hypothetical protein
MWEMSVAMDDKKANRSLSDVRPRSMDLRAPRSTGSVAPAAKPQPKAKPQPVEEPLFEPIKVDDKFDQIPTVKKPRRGLRVLGRVVAFVIAVVALAALYLFYIEPTYL